MDDGYISNGKSTPSYCSFNTTNKIKPQQAVEKTLKASRENYFNVHFNKTVNNVKETWKTINDLL